MSKNVIVLVLLILCINNQVIQIQQQQQTPIQSLSQAQNIPIQKQDDQQNESVLETGEQTSEVLSQQKDNQQDDLPKSEQATPSEQIDQAEGTIQTVEQQTSDKDQKEENDEKDEKQEKETQGGDTTSDNQYKEEFDKYVDGNNKKYNDQEKGLRYNIYSKNEDTVKKHNQNKENTYFLRMNNFADLSDQQFQKSYLMTIEDDPPKSVKPPMAPPQDFNASAVDWRDYAPNPAKVQGTCGACWAFSLIGAMETIIKIHRGDDYNFSEQQLVDCCLIGCRGCAGGWPAAAANCLAKGGVALSQNYPYVGYQGYCKRQIPTYHYIDKQLPYTLVQGVQSLMYAVQKAPVAVVIDASSWSMLYGGGLFTSCFPSWKPYNHAVTVMGVQEDGTWILRNSWGTQWGDNGHMYLYKGNSCNVASYGIVPQFQFQFLSKDDDDDSSDSIVRGENQDDNDDEDSNDFASDDDQDDEIDEDEDDEDEDE